MTLDSLLWFLIVLALSGLIVGAIARLLVPGPTPLGVLGTIGAGIAGSFLGGLVGRLLFGAAITAWGHLLLAVLGAVLVVALVSRGGRGRSYYGDEAVVYDRGYDDRVIVDDRPALRRRRRFF
jgi:uncharacterized membrane protein YeaQ/YmgE (transglycosylase-associated protein family)